MCLYPVLIYNRKYTKNKKNKGVIPPLKDKRTLYVPVGCGKCMECRKQKAREWQVRLQEEIRGNENNQYMVTLTFSEESIEKLVKEIKGLSGYELDNEIATIGTRRFLERWRKKYKKSIRHWLVTELGHQGTERIHIHGLMWTKEEVGEIEKIWQYGWVHIGEYVNEKTVNYIVKYISKTDEKHKEYKSKILTSKGIGRGYLKRFNSQQNIYKKTKTNETYTTRQGVKLALPIYYRNKIYNEEEREKLWLEKLDKEIRYVNGNKIDISKGEENYYNILKHEREKNKRLGYGDNSVNWERKKYENNRRNMLKLEKIKKKVNLGKADATRDNKP